MTTLKVTKIGNSMGVVLPKEFLKRHNLEKGDLLHLVDSPDGGLLTPYNPEFEAQMKVARQVMKKSRDVLRQLAK
jgi:putative addiction module antidote